MAVIIGGDANAYGIARAFHEQYAIKSLVVSKVLRGMVNHSKIIDNIIEPDLENNKVFLKTLIKIAKDRRFKKLILLAAGDWYVRLIIENRAKLNKYYIIPYIDKDLMNKLILKDSFYRLCEEFKIDYPKTFVYDLNHPSKLIFPFSYPIIVKPSNSVTYHYVAFENKKKVYTFNQLSDLKQMLNNLKTTSYQDKLIIQDFIPGDDTNMYVLTCYCDRQFKVKLYALGHVLLEEHTPGAIGNHAAIINEQNKKLFDLVKRFLEQVKYVGFCHFDFKYDVRDDKYKFFEINIRLGHNNYYITNSGVNIAKLLVDDYIYNQELPISIANKKHLTLIIPKLLLLKYLSNYQLRKEVKKLIKQKRFSNSLIYPRDLKFKRIIYLFANQLKQFLKYYKHYR